MTEEQPKQIHVLLKDETDINRFLAIKDRLGTNTNISTLRAVMTFFLLSKWLEKILANFEDRLLLSLAKSLIFSDASFKVEPDITRVKSATNDMT